MLDLNDLSLCKVRESNDDELLNLGAPFIYGGTEIGFNKKPTSIEDLKKEVALGQLSQFVDGIPAQVVAQHFDAIGMYELARLAEKSPSKISSTSNVDTFLFIAEPCEGLQICINIHSY